MSNTQKLLDRARSLCTPASDYQLAKRLGISASRLSNYRNRRSTPDNEIAFKLAKMLGMAITEVIAYFEEDKTTDPEKLEFWRGQLPRVLPSIAIAVATLSATWGPLIDGERGITLKAAQTALACHVIHYANSGYDG
jgi:transcriptional regulator with XRE-family HTH domain